MEQETEMATDYTAKIAPIETKEDVDALLSIILHDHIANPKD